jgi:hypothetical protein
MLALAGAALAALPGTASAAGSGLEAYRVTTDGQGFRLLQREGFDVTEARRGTDTIEVVATPGQARQLRKLGLQPKLKRNRQGLTALQYDAQVQRPDGSYDVWRPYFDDTYVGTDAQGRKRPTLYQELVALADANPDLVKREIIGRSGRGKPILALKITSDARGIPDGQRPVALYSAAQHAREWITPEMDRRWARYLVDQYRAGNAEIRTLLKTREVWVVPVANPDGYDFTFTPGNRLWRKTLREVNGVPGTQSGDGVDPNRNFPYKWGYDNEGSSPNPASETYRGPAPASEPETVAMDGLVRRLGAQMQVNYHSAAELLLYPTGWQVETPTIDDPIFRALSGTDAEPAIPGNPPGAPDYYDPDLSAELYTTNGETTDHVYARYGTLAWTPEMDVADPDRGAVGEDGGPPSVFEFQDSEADMQQAFEKNIPFALDVLKSAADPADPVSHLGNVAPPFEIHPFRVSYGDPQTVQVDAKRKLGRVTLRYSINGGRARRASTREWRGGERYGIVEDVYYHRVRGVVRGAKPGDQVRVWFEAGPRRRQVRSGSFTYEVASDTGAKVLVLANEDYTGPSNLPAYGRSDGASYAAYYEQALRDNGISYDVYDVDARDRTAPDPLGVLSHYRAVVWYTGNDLLTREPGQPAGTGVDKLADDMVLNVRDYLNEGGKLLYTGQWAGTQQWNGFAFNQLGQPPYCGGSSPPTTCISLSNDFLQYWLGAYLPIDLAGSFGALDPGAVNALPFDLAGGPFGTGSFRLNGGDSANNQGHVASFVTTSSILPPREFPQFSSTRAVGLDRPAAFDPVTGQYYMVAKSDDESYQRLTRTVDLSDVSSTADLRFKISYDTEPQYDYVVVEAHTVGQDDWTTLPDANGHTSDSVGESCDIDWNTIHPFLDHYQSNPPGDGNCTNTGTTGRWNGATGNSGGYQDWRIDLSAYKGKQVEVSVTYIQDFATAGLGVYLDDASVTKDGQVVDQTSFEDGTGGFTPASPPAGTEKQTTWVRSTSVGFVDGPGVATPDTLYYGFGFEGIRTRAQRTLVMGAAMRYLGATGARPVRR